MKKKFFVKRSYFIIISICIAYSIIVARLYHLQIDKFQNYNTLSLKNQFKIRTIPARRGSVYDRNRHPLAQDNPVVNIQILNQDDKSKKSTELFLKKNKIDPLTKTRENIIPINNPNQLLEIASRLNQHALTLIKNYRRSYNHPYLTAHLVGYYGRTNQDSLAKIPRYEREAHMVEGKSGIELQYNHLLEGFPGYIQEERNSKGELINKHITFEPKKGLDVFLTIDINLQKAAYESLKHQRGSIVAIEPHSGEILAMASAPSFDPNMLYNKKYSTQISKIIHNKNQPMFNRSIQGLYAPASTIKPFMAAAALSSKVIESDTTLFDPGYYYIPGSKHRFNNWLRAGHGKVNLIKALMVSCDTYFYEIAYKLGIDRISKNLSEFGFGKKTGAFSHEMAGHVPSKNEDNASEWMAGNTVITGIGQGTLLATPLQLAQATATIATHGKMYQPIIIKSIGRNGQTEEFTTHNIKHQLKYEQSIWENTIKGMEKVTSRYGTGRKFADFPLPIAGKSGTAQLVKIDRTRNFPDHLKDNTLFIAFAPIKKPEIAIAVIIENDKSATQVARDFMDKWYSIKLGQKHANETEMVDTHQ